MKTFYECRSADEREERTQRMIDIALANRGTEIGDMMIELLDEYMRVGILLVNLFRPANNYHELYEVGDGRNTISNQLAIALQKVDKGFMS